MKVELTYFNKRGKYKYSGDCNTKEDFMYQIFDEVRWMLSKGVRPGMIDGIGEYNVLVDVPDHKNNHPALIMYPYEIKGYVRLESYETI